MLARYEKWLQHAFQNQLFLCTYLYGKRVVPLACERVITFRVRAFTFSHTEIISHAPPHPPPPSPPLVPNFP